MADDDTSDDDTISVCKNGWCIGLCIITNELKWTLGQYFVNIFLQVKRRQCKIQCIT